jgi:CubicO group peptidase (beta-lactamase class C family)
VQGAVSIAAFQDAVDLPDNPAAHRLAELASLILEATPNRVIDYVRNHYTPACAEYLPLDKRVAAFMDWKARGGMKIVDVIASEPRRIQAVVCQPFTQERRVLAVHVDADAPHRIEAVMLGRAPLPTIVPALGDRAAADRFIAYTDRLAAADLFSGAVLIACHGEILAQQAWGLANRDFGAPNNLQTRFNVASVNKTWTAVAVAQLVESGKLSFDDRLSKFIDYPDRESASKIRIEHLLSHTSGLQNYFTETFDHKARQNVRTVDDFLAFSKDQPLVFEPGTDWNYSNTGMMVAGKVVEIVSGRTYFDYIQVNVLDRAGMDRSGFFELDRVNENLAVGYSKRWSASGVETVNNIFAHVVRGGPAGGGYSTIGDLLRFAEALRNGALTSKAMIKILTTAKAELNAPMYGYGFTIHPERALYGHEGRFTGISANLDMVEDPPGWTVIVLANDNGMRAPALKARQLIGVTVPETATRAALSSARPRAR